MKTAFQRLKSRLRGTWVHHMVWTYKHPPTTERNTNYDRQTVEVMFRVLRRGSNCIDIGAHTGEVLRYIVDIAPRGRHYAFEPLPHLAPGLNKRFPHVVVHQTAVSDRIGEAEFLYVKDDPAYSGLQRRIYDWPDPDITKISVRVVTLDEAIPADEKISFIKIDIEGGEYYAIRGGVETIRRGKAVVVFEGGSYSTGQYGVSPDDVYLLVTQTLGFELSTMERWLKRDPGYTREEFQRNWNEGPEYYFIAAPRRGK